ncbi:MAG: Uncharacterised protein [SAR116 cluster bacterium]|nr:MAG: Uncharacterised protein [SAR116 cluster bacterium]
MDEARRAADEAQNLAQIASELEKAAIAEGTDDAKAAAEEAAKAAEQASEAARVAGEAAMAAIPRASLRERRRKWPGKPPEVQPQRRLNNRHCAILKDACRVARFHRPNSTRR